MTIRSAFPTGGDYAEVLQDTSIAFLDPELVGCTLETNRFGLPRPISGNFASVFVATTKGHRKLAVKCFTRDVPDQHTRYREISTALMGVGGSWKVDFRFVRAGVRVRGNEYPILVMEWIPAKSLITWIEGHLADPAALAGLAGRFAAVVTDLEAAGIAHGDLQHGNLLVTDAGELKLIDYDGMFVPSLKHLDATELGHANYQHPRRSPTDYGPWLDRFSARVIYLSLSALAAQPDLWRHLHKDGGEFLLLQKRDLLDPAESQGLAVLRAVGGSVRAQVDELAGLLLKPLESIPALAAPASVPSASQSAAPVRAASWLGATQVTVPAALAAAGASGH